MYNQSFLPFVGIDDFAFLKGHNYGTIVSDLMTHHRIALPSDRKPETISTWLKNHPFIQIVSRGGYQAFRQAITKAMSSILQVYDRWHFIRAARRQIDACLPSILPPSLTFEKGIEIDKVLYNETKLQRKQRERQEKKWTMIKTIQQEYKKGKKKAELAKEFHLDPRTITKYIQITSIPIQSKRKRKRQTDGFHKQIEQLERDGKTVQQIFSQICEHGYTGTYSGVRIAVESIRKERKLQKSFTQPYRISRQQISSYIWKLSTNLSEEEIHLLKQCFIHYPSLQPFYETVQNFRKTYEEKDYPGFLIWLKEQLSSKNNHLYRYALRLQSDLQAIKHAFLTPFSNGIVERHVHRLKLMKRIMFGRAKLDLLEKRVLYHW